VKAARETDLVRQVKSYLELNGALAVRVNSGAFGGVYKGRKRFVRLNSEPGCSDLLACWDGIFLAVECKMPGERPTPAQAAFLDLVRKRGGIAGVVSDLGDVDALLNRARQL